MGILSDVEEISFFDFKQIFRKFLVSLRLCHLESFWDKSSSKGTGVHSRAKILFRVLKISFTMFRLKIDLIFDLAKN